MHAVTGDFAFTAVGDHFACSTSGSWQCGLSLANTGREGIGQCRFNARVKNVAGLMIILDRRLPTTVLKSWEPTVYRAGSSGRSVAGLQGMTLSFPLTRYPSVVENEQRLNAVAFSNWQQTLLEDVEVLNADTAVHTSRCQFQTIRGLKVGMTGNR